MTNCTAQYRKTLSRHLYCGRTGKNRILEKFDQDLADFQEDKPSPTTEDLNAAFGSPEELAQVLMADTTPAERGSYRRSRMAVRVLAAFALVAWITFTIFTYCFKEFSVIETFDEGYEDFTYSYEEDA